MCFQKFVVSLSMVWHYSSTLDKVHVDFSLLFVLLAFCWFHEIWYCLLTLGIVGRSLVELLLADKGFIVGGRVARNEQVLALWGPSCSRYHRLLLLKSKGWLGYSISRNHGDILNFSLRSPFSCLFCCFIHHLDHSINLIHNNLCRWWLNPNRVHVDIMVARSWILII